MAPPDRPAALSERVSRWFYTTHSALAALVLCLGAIGAVVIAHSIATAVRPTTLGVALGALAAVGFVLATILAFDAGRQR